MAEEDDLAAAADDRGRGVDADPPDGGWTFEAQAHYDPAEPRDLTTVIVCAVAEAEGVPITQVLSPPLYDVVDVAALEEALFGRSDGTTERLESAVEFRYHGYKVSVAATGWVTVSTRADGTSVD